jgi:hypothetical protein
VLFFFVLFFFVSFFFVRLRVASWTAFLNDTTSALFSLDPRGFRSRF